MTDLACIREIDINENIPVNDSLVQLRKVNSSKINDLLALQQTADKYYKSKSTSEAIVGYSQCISTSIHILNESIMKSYVDMYDNYAIVVYCESVNDSQVCILDRVSLETFMKHSREILIPVVLTLLTTMSRLARLKNDLVLFQHIHTMFELVCTFEVKESLWQAFLHRAAVVDFQAIQQMVVTHRKAGDFGAAIQLCRFTSQRLVSCMGQDHPIIADAWSLLAGLLSAHGKYAEALTLYKRALALRETIFANDSEKVASTQSNIALTLYHLEDYIEALTWINKAIKIREALFMKTNEASTTTDATNDLIISEGPSASTIEATAANSNRDDKMTLLISDAIYVKAIVEYAKFDVSFAFDHYIAVLKLRKSVYSKSGISFGKLLRALETEKLNESNGESDAEFNQKITTISKTLLKRFEKVRMSKAGEISVETQITLNFADLLRIAQILQNIAECFEQASQFRRALIVFNLSRLIRTWIKDDLELQYNLTAFTNSSETMHHFDQDQLFPTPEGLNDDQSVSVVSVDTHAKMGAGDEHSLNSGVLSNTFHSTNNQSAFYYIQSDGSNKTSQSLKLPSVNHINHEESSAVTSPHSPNFLFANIENNSASVSAKQRSDEHQNVVMISSDLHKAYRDLTRNYLSICELFLNCDALGSVQVMRHLVLIVRSLLKMRTKISSKLFDFKVDVLRFRVLVSRFQQIKGNFDKSRTQLRLSMQNSQDIYDNEMSSKYSTLIFQLASVAKLSGYFSEAKTLLTHCLKIRMNLFSKSHPLNSEVYLELIEVELYSGTSINSCLLLVQDIISQLESPADVLTKQSNTLFRCKIIQVYLSCLDFIENIPTSESVATTVESQQLVAIDDKLRGFLSELENITQELQEYLSSRISSVHEPAAKQENNAEKTCCFGSDTMYLLNLTRIRILMLFNRFEDAHSTIKSIRSQLDYCSSHYSVENVSENSTNTETILELISYEIIRENKAIIDSPRSRLSSSTDIDNDTLVTGAGSERTCFHQMANYWHAIVVACHLKHSASALDSQQVTELQELVLNQLLESRSFHKNEKEDSRLANVATLAETMVRLSRGDVVLNDSVFRRFLGSLMGKDENELFAVDCKPGRFQQVYFYPVYLQLDLDLSRKCLMVSFSRCPMSVSFILQIGEEYVTTLSDKSNVPMEVFVDHDQFTAQDEQTDSSVTEAMTHIIDGNNSNNQLDDSLMEDNCDVNEVTSTQADTEVIINEIIEICNCDISEKLEVSNVIEFLKSEVERLQLLENSVQTVEISAAVEVPVIEVLPAEPLLLEISVQTIEVSAAVEVPVIELLPAEVKHLSRFEVDYIVPLDDAEISASLLLCVKIDDELLNDSIQSKILKAQQDAKDKQREEEDEKIRKQNEIYYQKRRVVIMEEVTKKTVEELIMSEIASYMNPIAKDLIAAKNNDISSILSTYLQFQVLEEDFIPQISREVSQEAYNILMDEYLAYIDQLKDEFAFEILEIVALEYVQSIAPELCEAVYTIERDKIRIQNPFENLRHVKVKTKGRKQNFEELFVDVQSGDFIGRKFRWLRKLGKNYMQADDWEAEEVKNDTDSTGYNENLGIHIHPTHSIEEIEQHMLDSVEGESGSDEEEFDGDVEAPIESETEILPNNIASNCTNVEPQTTPSHHDPAHHHHHHHHHKKHSSFRNNLSWHELNNSDVRTELLKSSTEYQTKKSIRRQELDCEKQLQLQLKLQLNCNFNRPKTTGSSPSNHQQGFDFSRPTSPSSQQNSSQNQSKICSNSNSPDNNIVLKSVSTIGSIKHSVTLPSINNKSHSAGLDPPSLIFEDTTRPCSSGLDAIPQQSQSSIGSTSITGKRRKKLIIVKKNIRIDPSALVTSSSSLDSPSVWSTFSAMQTAEESSHQAKSAYSPNSTKKTRFAQTAQNVIDL